MMYNDIASQQDYRGACALYVSEVYGEAVPHLFPAVAETLWISIMAGATEELAQLHILSDHRLSVPAV